MASSSSTSFVQKSYKYDVFLSFRGEDTRKTFVDHLYHALQQKSIHTYKDDERIKKGERIGDELIKSIEDSKFYIIVFSKNYASSSWCLDELVKIIECQKMTSEHTAYPVFYDVEPTEVRKQSGEFGKAFANQEKEEAAEKWREALKEAANLSGFGLKNTVDGHEAKFIQKIVEEISLELRSINVDIDEKLVGMETRIKGVVSSLDMGFDDVRMIGILGMGGAGKTTLARAVFDRISFKFEGRSFVENVREVSTNSLYGLKKLQKQVLKDVLNDQAIKISNVHEGKKMMKNRMCCIKVLIVLDDVDNIHQLEALAGEHNWFKPGSRIIITTRDEQPLVAHGINSILYASLLSNREALCLFSRYAFGKEIPIQRYKELSKQVVLYAAGLPLALTVLGSFLCGKNEIEWKNVIQRLKTIPSKDTFDILEISYKGLEEEYKDIFLDVACIFKGFDKDDAIKALESCGFYATIGLRVLEQKSLITISENGRLDMHDKIEEMGQYIVRRKHEEPTKHSRLWINEEIKDILVSDQGTNEAIRCIKLYISKKLNPEIVMKGLGNMKKLRFLQVHDGDRDYFNNNWKFDADRPYFPNALRSLRWIRYPFGSLPKSFQANNLVELNMPNSKIVQLWEGEDTKVLNKLRFLDLSYSKLKILDLGLTPNLETLRIDGCYDLVELHMSAECPKLISLTVGPSRLMTLDLRAGTPNLEKLYLCECVNLVELHIPDELLKLKSIKIDRSKLRTLDLRGTPNLENLDLDECVNLAELHIPDECRKLKSIKIIDSKLRRLDLRGTPNLKDLSLYKCVDLVELHIPNELLKIESIIIDGSMVRTLDIRGTPNLKTLFLTECYHLEEVHAHDGCLKSLDYIELSGCLRFKSFLHMKSVVVGCELHLKAESLEMCPLHIGNNLPKFRFECSYKEHGSSLIGNLEKLIISFGRCACTNLERFSQSICGLQGLTKLTLEGSILEVPKDLDQLECLKELNLFSINVTHLPDNICKLKHLKCLKIDRCCLLEKLPEDLGRLECLEKLYLLSTEITHLPDSICKLKHLKCLKLDRCWLLEKLPEDLGRIECLVELHLLSTDITHLPDSICKLKHLKCLKLVHCWLLEKLPEDLDGLECLEELHLLSTKITHLPDNICKLKHLKCLILDDCCLLEKLPEDLGRLECLEKLILSECVFLQHIPDSICRMKCLQNFLLSGCTAVGKLPEEIGRLKCLKKLHIGGTNIRHLPESIFELKGLCIVGYRRHLQTYGFTSQLSEHGISWYVES